MTKSPNLFYLYNEATFILFDSQLPKFCDIIDVRAVMPLSHKAAGDS